MTHDGYFDILRDRIAAARVEGHAVRRWRITWRTGDRVSLGMKDNRIGNVHAPIEREWARKGSFLLEWDTGELSRGNIDGGSLPGLPEILEGAWASRCRDEDGAQFLGPGTYPEIALSAPEVLSLLNGGLPRIGEIVGRLREWGRAQGARNVSGGVTASTGRRGVMTSEGLSVDEAATSFSFYAFLDGEISAGDSSRRVFSAEQIEERLRFPGALFRATRAERPWGARRQTEVVLHPKVAMAFLDHFVFSNLQGLSVVRGQSPWSAEEFHAGKQVFRGDLRLGVDPHIPWSPGSCRFTGEGVPTEKQDFIRDGRLVRPILDLKYARKAGLAPSTPPSSEESIVLEAEGTRDWAEHLGSIEEGILVVGVLGMHTQDRARGEYSLAAPTCAVLEGGGIAGKARAVLVDSFFSNLRSDSLRLVHFPFHSLPGIAFRSVVSPDKGE